MSVTTSQIIESARSFLGVRYQHQGRSREDGLDCGGLLLVVGRELGITELEFLGYSTAPDGETFERLLNEQLDEIIPKENLQIADIIACDYGDGIQHTAFVTRIEPLTVIHAKRPRGQFHRRGVIETRMFGTEDERAWVKTFRVRGVIAD